MSKSFACPYTSTAIMSLMAGLQCSVIGVGVEWRLSAWALGWDIRLAAVLYIVSIDLRPSAFALRGSFSPDRLYLRCSIATYNSHTASLDSSREYVYIYIYRRLDPHKSLKFWALRHFKHELRLAKYFTSNRYRWDQKQKLSDILTLILHQGIIGSGLAFALMSWCIQKRGPLYVSMFSPLLLVIVAILGWAILDEKLYVGRYI